MKPTILSIITIPKITRSGDPLASESNKQRLISIYLNRGCTLEHAHQVFKRENRKLWAMATRTP